MQTSPFIYDPPKNPFLDVLYEDADIIVVNKPSGILSVPGKKAEYFDSILSRVRAKYPEAHAVHRLDLGTSGVLVVGLHKEAVSKLGRQFMERKPLKRYVAWVSGNINKGGTIDLPLRTDIDNRPYQIVDFKEGRPALTCYEPLFNDYIKKQCLVKLMPKTGRSHQLRVHCKEIGHPIFGDHLYAPEDVFKAAAHLYLHAYYLKFWHPVTSDAMEFFAPPPFEIPKNISLC